jgi:hypothetical protein
MAFSRRSFLNTAPLVLAPSFWRPAASGPGPSFPTQPPELAREMVGVSHSNLARVNELLALHPTLARASWDWGFGDWEDALGAASHVGNREIALALIAAGARPTIFSAAMLGQLDVIRTFVAASPGIEATPGPHGITLLRHALAGGPAAQPVADYLKTLPGADRRPETKSLTAEEIAAIAGEYIYGAGADERITIAMVNNLLQFTRTGRSGRVLTHVGERTFFPVGAPLVRIRFRDSAAGVTMTVHDPDLVLEARRTR